MLNGPGPASTLNSARLIAPEIVYSVVAGGSMLYGPVGLALPRTLWFPHCSRQHHCSQLHMQRRRHPNFLRFVPRGRPMDRRGTHNAGQNMRVATGSILILLAASARTGSANCIESQGIVAGGGEGLLDLTVLLSAGPPGIVPAVSGTEWVIPWAIPYGHCSRLKVLEDLEICWERGLIVVVSHRGHRPSTLSIPHTQLGSVSTVAPEMLSITSESSTTTDPFGY